MDLIGDHAVESYTLEHTRISCISDIALTGKLPSTSSEVEDIRRRGSPGYGKRDHLLHVPATDNCLFFVFELISILTTKILGLLIKNEALDPKWKQ